MKREMTTGMGCLMAVLVLVGLVLASPVMADSGKSLPDPGHDPMSIVYYEIARQAVEGMPNDNLYPYLTIGELEGDEGLLAGALRATIGAVTDYKFLELAEFKKLMEAKEKREKIEKTGKPAPVPLVAAEAKPGESEKPSKGEAAKKRPGWYLQGKIVQMLDTPIYSSATVFLEMKNVETGQVAFAKTFVAAYIPPMVKYVALAMAVLFLLLIGTIYRALRRRRQLKGAVAESDRLQLAVAAELKKTRDNLARMHDHFARNNAIDMAVRVREQQNEIDHLLQKVERHPGLHPATVNHPRRKEQERHDKLMLSLVRNLQAESEKLVKQAEKGSDGHVATLLSELAAEIKNCRNKLYDNRAGMA